MRTVLHLGTGNFHRAHQAAYTQAANDLGGAPWELVGVSLRSPDIRDALRPQGFDYTLAIKDADGVRYDRITCIRDILFAPDDPGAVIAAIARADLVTLTITEKGYCLDADGQLDLDHPDIQSDLQATPSTAIGLLAHGLANRQSGVAVLSCDNLNENGRKLEAAVRRFAQAARLELPEDVLFPSSMVDRITLATSDELRSEVLAETGQEDGAPVETEAFSDWVIEVFDAPHPDWDSVGAQFVEDVSPYELRKLRMLNGAHSTLAYAGLAASVTYVHEAVDDPALVQLAAGVMKEAAQTLPPDIEATNYAQALLDRFANPALRHRLRQIAMDGSQKLPVRLVQTLKDRTARGLASPKIEAGIDAWVRFVMSEVDAGRTLDDPMASALEDAARSAEPERAIRKLIGL